MIHKGDSNYHSPTRFTCARAPAALCRRRQRRAARRLGRVRPLAADARALRRARRNENKQTIAAKLHVLASFEPMAVDDTSDDNADDAPPPAVSVVGGESKIERRPFLGGRALMSCDVLAAAFATTKSKQRRAVLVDGTGQLPPHLLLEDLQRPARPFLSVVPPIAIMPAVDSNVGINSSFVEPVLSRGDSSTGTVDFSDRGDEEASDTFMSLTAQSEDSASGGSKEKGTFGRVLILANAKTKVVDALTLELSVHGSPPQVLTFETAAIADRWRRAFAAFHAARGGWYLRDVREPKWSNVRDLAVAPQTLGVDNAALDLPPMVVTRAAMSRAIDAAIAGRTEYDAVAAPDFVVEALMASASDHDDDPRGELGSSSSSGSLLSSTASSSTLGSISVPQSTTSAAIRQRRRCKSLSTASRAPPPSSTSSSRRCDDRRRRAATPTRATTTTRLATAATAPPSRRAASWRRRRGWRRAAAAAAAAAKKPAVESQYGRAPATSRGRVGLHGAAESV
jgi:hypothetical protein